MHRQPPSILALTPTAFVLLLKKSKVSSLHFATVNGKLIASHAFLQPIADFFQEESDDYDTHEGFFLQIGARSGVLQFFRDGLRLSKGMTHKNALAGIWWGGGKGVMARNTGSGLMPGESAESRRIVYEEYGTFMSSLHGCYVTAEDVGTNVNDMAAIFSKTRHTTCIPAELGGSGNPSIPTARGVLRGIEAAFASNKKNIVGSTIAVQGAGHVGMPLIQFLFEIGVGKVIASDVDAHRAADIRKMFSSKNFELCIVEKSDNSILFLGKIVCGAANNQLRDISKDDRLLAQHGITYLPDFLVNRMGIVNCCDEHMGVLDEDPKLEEHLGNEWDNAIFNLSLRVLKQAKDTGKTTQQIAIDLAEKRSMETNPLYGHRGVKIIKWLIGSNEWKHKL
ncbi:hypothetical protein BSLG_006649 [Batrachochytrium salamandrivorans]|nr:hypothetical protein BSLG_006649 [Batrachochytrium salamandrivorans]